MATVQELKEAYKGEWLAIAVAKRGEAGIEEGELVHHSKDADEVWRRIKGDKRKIYVTYAGPPLPEGYAAAF